MTSSYCFRSRRLARRALMIRILSPRSVCTTTSNLSRCERPKIMKRFSACECAGSKIVTESGSPNTVAASSKGTPCLARFNRALLASHSKVSTPEIQTPIARIVHPKMNTGKEFPSVASDFRHRPASCVRPAPRCPGGIRILSHKAQALSSAALTFFKSGSGTTPSRFSNRTDGSEPMA